MAKKRRHNRILSAEQKASMWMSKNIENFMFENGEVDEMTLAKQASKMYNLFDENGDIPEFLINQASVITERYFK